ncbi:MAG: hypothetical protein JW909_10335 [Planctomycetes bacterium]|nr:hypothetical protein [Planctomycetota bacterium]
MKSSWLKFGKILYACGLFIMAAALYDPFLTAYGRGGIPAVLEPREALAAGHTYILRNHGVATPVSDVYYDMLLKSSRISRFLLMAAVPFLVLGMLATVIDGWKWSITSARGRVMLWVRLFIPSPGEPLAASVAKTYLWLLLAAVFSLGSVFDTASLGEKGHVRIVWAAYAACLPCAALLALLLRLLLPGPAHRDPSAAVPRQNG